MRATYETHMGSDDLVCDMARQSFSKLAKDYTPNENESLIHFLANGKTSKDINKFLDSVETAERSHLWVLLRQFRLDPTHFAPFAHPHITLRMQAPIPIRTQCFKHKIGLTESEESRRYISSTPDLFLPDTFRAVPEGSIKQGSGAEHLYSENLLAVYEETCRKSIAIYEHWIEHGVAPEQARLILPQGVEVNWGWTGSLYAFANFYNQRTGDHAQKEINDLAMMVREIIEPLYPISWKALTNKVVT